ncbi:unnamed protein product [Dibothriocephalus latus]|uniref:Bromodomain adjacent to zinc finger domain protein 1A n=1 Tax=Dibothriocephalus latus TaxID=60516 RepID=A0A3P6UPL3_DIBLA|nr:unnamed protein product [Dibothriocephalus latus]
MPLLGNKLHVLNATVKKTKKNAEEEQVTNDFVVPETREICSSKEELDRKNVIYDAKVWTCRVTGRLNLTHKEATKSEQASNNILKKAIQPHFRTAILEVVHLNTLALEPLVTSCWTKLQEQFLVGEPVLLKVDASKPIHATIIEVDYTVEEPEVIDLCNDNSSPTQSDKENAGVKRLPIPKKNYSYSVKLVSEEPVVVKHVPSRSIQRLHRPPSKDHVRMFIRSNAMRYGPASSGPWIVDPSALRRYCSHVKSNQDPIDRKKLRKLSETYEERYFARIMNERSRSGQQVEENGVKRSPQVVKVKNSVLQDGASKSEKVVPNKKKTSDATPKKKLKQATLSFGKPIDLTKDETPDKSEPVAPKKPVLPLTAKRLLRALKNNVEGAALTLHLSRCAKLLTDEQIAFLPEDIQKRNLKELGIKVSKLPVTPYTAPEFLRLLLVRELSHGFTSTRDRTMAFLRSVGVHTKDEFEVDSTVPTPGTVSLANKLSSFDIFALDAEHKILLLELLIERLLDVDSIDDYMHSTDRKATNAYNKRLAAERNRRKLLPNLQNKKETGGEDTGAETNSDADMDDLASVVKRRRQLAAQAASEREHKEALERERRELEAQLLAENKAAARATQEYYAAALEARIARRITPLGVDRQNRRYWHFFCAPHMLFLEADCAADENSQKPKTPLKVSDALPDSTAQVDKASTSLPTSPRRTSNHTAALELANLLGSASNSRWFVFDQSEQLDHLNDSLMTRGYREGPLKKELSQNNVLSTVKELLEGISSVQKGKPAQEELSPKSGKGSAVDLVTAKCRGDARAILANVLLKNIYETEIHLRDGGLGGVPDFPSWVSAVLAVQSRFGLVFSLTKDAVTPTKGEADSNIHGSDLQALSEILVEVGDNVLRRYLNVPKPKEYKKKARRKGEDVDGYEDNAMTTWGQFGKSDATEEEEEENSTSNEDEEEDSAATLTEFDRLKAREADVEVWINTWRDQVRAASTISRLNLLHACLDACIVWEKSVENARCRICRRKKDDEKLLLCDGCNQGFHLYCLRPPLKSIPRGDWFCVSSSASSMLNNNNDATCLVCNRDCGDLIGCSSCPNSFHLQCHNPIVRPAQTRTLWLCSVCRFSGSKAGSSAIAQALRPRGSSRYLRLHRMSTGEPIKRPHSGSDNESSVTTEANGSVVSGDDDDDQDSDASGPGRCLRRSSRYSNSSTREPPTKKMRSSNAAPSPSPAEPTCADIVAAVCRNRNSWPFREPVDPTQVPDYYDIIVEPIDLSMIQKRLSEGCYDGPKGHAVLAADLGKMFYNAELYNSADSEVWVAGSHLEHFVQSLFRKCSPRE